MVIPFLSKIFSPSDPDQISFYKLYNNLRKWNDSKVYPYEYELPQSITFPEDFWKRIIQLYKETRADAHERAISVFWADGDLIVSSVVKGTTSSVTPKNKVSVKYSPSRNKGYVTKEVLVDDKLYSKKDVYHKNMPKSIEVKYLFNMHTHPPHKVESFIPQGYTQSSYEQEIYYSFFSLQDLKSLVASGAVITGMISDRLWLLVRTNQTPSIINITEPEINIQTLNHHLHIAVYSGEFNGKVRRVE